MLGEAKVPIIDIDLTMPVDEWRILQPEFKMETKGVSMEFALQSIELLAFFVYPRILQVVRF